ncbi:U-box domain-containing protein 15 [Striga asiatica]|uniref:RING-type E3 ubiquitin transferase n=1 Tax=Striga asiatica TaxID=4170 RepID=A0A5A7QF43_STRAF|nr:U-box domain-containing protein 15 [Striga asiatica]
MTKKNSLNLEKKHTKKHQTGGFPSPPNQISTTYKGEEKKQINKQKRNYIKKIIIIKIKKKRRKKPFALQLFDKKTSRMVTNHELIELDDEIDQGLEASSNPSSPRASRTGANVVDEIIDIIESVKAIGEYRRTQRKECSILVRRLKLFLPVLEEIKDVDKPIVPESGTIYLKRLKKAFQSAKKLLKLCHGGSKIYLALESEAMMVRFHGVYENISQAVEGMPYEELGISDEEKEQVELLRMQLRRAKKRTDTQDIELTMDLMVALSTNNETNASIASVERLANKLSLHTPNELAHETLAIRKLVKERRGLGAESTQQIINLLNKFKKLAGVAENGILDDPDVPKSLTKCMSIAVPNEFLCPITLEIMTDPVIVATGQTYERDRIQQWLDSNHRTCPKTGQVLSHLSLTSNYALKNLILQWCEQNKFQLPKKKSPSASDESAHSTADVEKKISSLVKSLSSSKLDEQREAVKKIRLLSKESPDNRTIIANSGGIKRLVSLLSYPDSKIQEHAVTALLNLSIDECNKKLISDKEEAIPAIIEILQKGKVGAQENSAAALFSLSMLDENKVKIGTLNGIPPLVELLRTGTIRGKKDAMTALFNLCLNPGNKSRAVEAGIVEPLLKMLVDEKIEMVNETLSILLVLASSQEGRKELGRLSFIETLVSLIRDGTPKNRECATAVLLELGSRNRNLVLAALQYGVYENLVEVSKSGTERGQRKAGSLLRVMSQAEQIPTEASM